MVYKPLRRALRPGAVGIQKQSAIAYKRLDIPADWLSSALIFATTGTFLITTYQFQYSKLQRQRRKNAGSVRKNLRAGQEKRAAYRGKAGIFGYFPSLESTAPQAWQAKGMCFCAVRKVSCFILQTSI